MDEGRAELSVVIPAYDAYVDDFLREAIASLRRQDFPARVLVVDNASAVAIPVVEGVELVKTPERLTLGQARNLGLHEVTTPYVLFWDADDVMLPGTLERLHRGIASDPDVVAYAASIVNLESMTTHRWPRRWAYGLARRPRAFALANSIWSLFPTVGSTLMRTASVREAGGFGRADSGDDWVLGAALAFRGRVVLSHAPGRLYRRERHSLWAEHSSRRHLRKHSSEVRERLSADPVVPRWVKLLLPLISVAQQVSVYVIQPLVVLSRRVWSRDKRIAA